MNLKKSIAAILLLLSISLTLPAAAYNNTPAATPVETPAAAARLEAIKARLIEIRGMDKTSLTYTEKKDLKNEVKALKKEVREGHRRGVFLSVGAIIIIILLLILIL
ncbi:MAG: hypothetical protein JSU03_05125 [Bacteroidetes bacterium]|nr:hypothetical protein [Bacteroidota bacterium]